MSILSCNIVCIVKVLVIFTHCLQSTQHTHTLTVVQTGAKKKYIKLRRTRTFFGQRLRGLKSNPYNAITPSLPPFRPLPFVWFLTRSHHPGKSCLSRTVFEIFLLVDTCTGCRSRSFPVTMPLFRGKFGCTRHSSVATKVILFSRLSPPSALLFLHPPFYLLHFPKRLAMFHQRILHIEPRKNCPGNMRYFLQLFEWISWFKVLAMRVSW